MKRNAADGLFTKSSRFNDMADCLFIAGTDTGVGKSVVSVLLMQILYAKGYHPFYLKPFQTGCKNPCDADSDAGFVYEHVSALRGKHPGNSTSRRPPTLPLVMKGKGVTWISCQRL